MSAKRSSASMVASVVTVIAMLAWALFSTRHRASDGSGSARSGEERPVEPVRVQRDAPHWADRAALIVALLSTVVSGIALVVSVQLAQHPYPADPTQLPTFGTQQEGRYIGSVADSYELFDFLRENAGRKVRLNVGFDMHVFKLDLPGYTELDDTVPEDVVPEGLMPVPSPNCHGALNDTDPSCTGIKLQVNDVSKDRPALELDRGTYSLNGYFADLGSFGIHTGNEGIAITPLTAIEAVN